MAQLARLSLAGCPRIALLHAGRGDLVLFLHGIGGNKENWLPQLETFSAHFQVAAWDMRGYGESDEYAGPLQFEDLNDDILRVLTHLKVDRVHLVGLSMGGRIAFEFVHSYPEYVRSLTVCSATHHAGQMSRQRRADFLKSRLQPLREEGKAPSDIAADVVGSLLGPNATIEVRNRLIDSMRMLRVDSYVKALEAVCLQDREVILENIPVPTLVLAASEDRLIPPSVLRPIAQRIPDSRYHEITDCGHLSNLERPEAFEAVVLPFLKQYARCLENKECRD